MGHFYPDFRKEDIMRTKKFKRKEVPDVLTVRESLKKGDLATRLSCVVMGAGNIRRGREQFDVWLHTVGLKGENIAESVPEEFRETGFRIRQPENTAEWKKWRKNASYMCIVLVAGILMIAIGIACKFLWMFIIGMLILLPAVLFFAVRGELPARWNFLRKYDGVTFLQDGLLLTGSKPKRIPRRKIHQVTFSTAYENKEEILIADFYLKSLLNTAAFAFQLRSDYFTEPERFAASCRLWHKTVFDHDHRFRA